MICTKCGDEWPERKTRVVSGDGKVIARRCPGCGELYPAPRVPALAQWTTKTGKTGRKERGE